MKILRMKPEYIQWTKAGNKTATTRMSIHPCGEYELAESIGTFFKVKKTGIIIKVIEITAWTQNNIKANFYQQERIRKAEGFSSWQEFWDVIQEINKHKTIDGETLFYTHFFEVVK